MLYEHTDVREEDQFKLRQTLVQFGRKTVVTADILSRLWPSCLEREVWRLAYPYVGIRKDRVKDVRLGVRTTQFERGGDQNYNPFTVPSAPQRFLAAGEQKRSEDDRHNLADDLGQGKAVARQGAHREPWSCLAK